MNGCHTRKQMVVGCYRSCTQTVIRRNIWAGPLWINNEEKRTYSSGICTQCWSVASHRRFGKAYRYHLQQSRKPPKRNFLHGLMMGPTGCPETSPVTTDRHCKTSQKIEDLICTAGEAWRHAMKTKVTYPHSSNLVVWEILFFVQDRCIHCMTLIHLFHCLTLLRVEF